MQGFFKSNPALKTSQAHLSDRRKLILAHKGEMELVIPKIRWSQQNLTHDQSAVNLLQTLQGKKLVSTRTVLNIIGLNPEVEKSNLENERGTVFDPDAPKTGPLPGMKDYDENQAKQAQDAPEGMPDMGGMPDFAAKQDNMTRLGNTENDNLVKESQSFNNNIIKDERKLSDFF